MSVELKWVVDASSACFHVVDLLLRSRPVNDAALAEALTPATEALASEIDASGVSLELFLTHLVPLSANFGSNRQLASVLLTKLAGAQRTEQRIDRLTELFTQLESAFSRAAPDLAEQITRDSEPLRRDWDIHGETLLHSVRRLVEENVVVPRADVILVPPVQGGGGAAHLLYNSVRIEVLPPDRQPNVPEVVRLAWLIAQLNADLPMYQGELHRDRLAQVAALAMLPAVATAAVDLGLLEDRAGVIAAVVAAWGIASSGQTPLADVLTRWWETWQSQRPEWSIALAALDRLLA